MPDNIATKNYSWLSELSKQLLAYSSVLAALSYLLGRSYYLGYFDALGIDISFIRLSWVEYLESGWLFLWVTGMLWVIILEYGLFALIVYNFIAPLFDEWAKQHKILLGIIFLVAWVAFLIYINRASVLAFLLNRTRNQWIVFVLLVVLIIVFRKLIAKRLTSWFRILGSNPEYLDKIDKYARISDRLLVQMGVLLIFIITLYYISLGAERFGKAVGVVYLNQKAKDIELVSTLPILPSAVSNIGNVYTQDGLRFLFFNDGHYFLSKLDGKCKPQEVYVVNESNIVNIRMNQPLPSQICSMP